MKYAWIEKHCTQESLELYCRVLEVCPSGYHAWRQREPSPTERRRVELEREIKAAHEENRCAYGSPRLQVELSARGIKCCENTVAKFMRELDLRSKRGKRFVPSTTDSNHAHPVAENVLDRDFTADAPNQKWVADITYIPTAEGWMYVAAVMDLFSRKIVGWSMSNHMRAELVLDALQMALKRRKPKSDLMHHSDRGVQYACGEYRRMLDENGIECSMSRTGNCYDNAAMESFWSTLKTECTHHENYLTVEQASLSVFEYVEVFYNRVRRHSSIGYISPEQFEAAMN